jgi:ubiquinone/menaquinone biosynthesis C-methylase UbiE/DNA-binding transcriptional ArsR family regulator
MSGLETLLTGLRAAGERTRLRLLFLLSHGELNVKELTQILGQSQPRISRHLKLLCEAGLLERHREGSWVLFRLCDGGVPGALARTIVDMTSSSSAEIQRDLRRLDEVRQAREAAASDYFKASAADWGKIRSLHISEDQVEAAIVAAVGDERAATLLDLGTGTGRMLGLLADRFDQGIGVDMSHAMLAIARSDLERRGLAQCQVRHGDLFHLPYDNGSVDLITIHQVLHYLNDPERALQEAARVLAPGGRMLVVDFAPHELEFLRDDHAHRRLGIDDEQMQHWLTKAGITGCRHRVLPPQIGGEEQGLTVSIWIARASPAAQSADLSRGGEHEKVVD